MGNSTSAGAAAVHGLVSQVQEVRDQQQADTDHGQPRFERSIEDVTYRHEHDHKAKRTQPKTQHLTVRPIPVPEGVNADR